MPPTAAINGVNKDTARGIFDDIQRQLTLTQDVLLGITEQFLEDFRLGLSSYNQSMAMIPTFVTGVPNGTETGTFLALDLGGTNLRVCEVTLEGNHHFSLRQQKYKVSEQLKTGEAKALFDYLADSVDAFLTDSMTATGAPGSPTQPHPPGEYPESDPFASPDLSEPTIPLGLTFSFPVEQTALNEGKILTWTKGFSAKNAIGNDVVRLLQDAFDRKHLHVRCVALVNDTVGAMLSRAYTAGGCILGAIFGTGTNGAYLEKVENITKFDDSPAHQQGGYMVVNTEWGGFNNSRSKLPTTPYDNKLDRESINPHLQAFEKFISGMYLGEITRNITLSLVDAAPQPLIFSGYTSDDLNRHYGLDTAILSAVEEAWLAGRSTESDSAPTTNGITDAPYDSPPPHPYTDVSKLDPSDVSRLERIRGILIQRLSLKDEHVSLQDAATFLWISSLVADRAARLSATAIAAVLVQTGRAKLGGGFVPKEEKIQVGVDGSLIQHYPKFKARLLESLRGLVGKEVESRVEIEMAQDGSGVGAALCALQATKQGH